MSYEYQSPTGAAIGFVNQGWGYFENKIEYFAQGAVDLIGMLVEAGDQTPYVFQIEFPTTTGLTAFTKPARPTLLSIPASDIDVPPAPDAESLGLPQIDLSLERAPTYSEIRAELERDIVRVTLPDQPSALDVDYGTVPDIRDLESATMDEYATPVLAELRDIVLPERVVLDEIDFDVAIRPPTPTLPDLSAVGFTEQPYTREVLNEVAAEVRRALAGGSAIATHVENAIFERARNKIERTNRKAKVEASELFSGRGYVEPPGAWAERVHDSIRSGQDQTTDTNREITIYAHDAEVKAVQNAMVQGIALEQILIGQANAINDRQLQMAKLLLDTHVAMFNAQVTVFNSEQEGRRVDMEVIRARIELRASRLLAWKTELEGLSLVGELNKIDAEIYATEWRAIQTIVDKFKVANEAVKVQAEIDETRMRGYEAFLRGVGEKVKAKSIEWEGYTAAVNAQGQHFRNFEVGVNAFGTRLNAHGELERQKTARYDLMLRKSLALLEVYRGRLQGVTAELAELQNRQNAIAQSNDGQARMYQADGQIEVSRTEANNRAYSIASENNNNRVQAKISEATIKSQNVERIMNVQVEALKGATQGWVQLCASSMSAVNFSAGVNGSGSESISQSYSLSKSRGFNWSGETEDNNSPDIY